MDETAKISINLVFQGATEVKQTGIRFHQLTTNVLMLIGIRHSKIISGFASHGTLGTYLT